MKMQDDIPCHSNTHLDRPPFTYHHSSAGLHKSVMQESMSYFCLFFSSIFSLQPLALLFFFSFKHWSGYFSRGGICSALFLSLLLRDKHKQTQLRRSQEVMWSAFFLPTHEYAFVLSVMFNRLMMRSVILNKYKKHHLKVHNIYLFLCSGV